MTKIVTHLLIISLFALATVEILHAIASPVITAKEDQTDLMNSVARSLTFLKKRQVDSKPDFHSKTVDPNLIAKLARAKIGKSHRFRRAGARFEDDAVNRDLETTQVETAEAAIDAEEAKDSSIEALIASTKLQQDLAANPNLQTKPQNLYEDNKRIPKPSPEHHKTEVDEKDASYDSSNNDDVETNKHDENDQEDDSDEEHEPNHDDDDHEDEDDNDNGANDEVDHKDASAHEIIVEDGDVTVKDLDIDLNTKGDQTGKGEDKNNKDNSDKKHGDKDKEHNEKEPGDKDQDHIEKEHGDKDKQHNEKDHGDKDKKHLSKDKEHKDRENEKGGAGPSVCQGLLDFKRMSDDFRSRLQHLIEQEEDVVKRLENWEKSLENGPEEPSKRKQHKKGSADSKKYSKPKTKACVSIEEDDEPKPDKSKPKPHSGDKVDKSHFKNHKSMSSDEQKGIPIIEAHIRHPEESFSHRRHGYRRFRTKKSKKVIRESDPRGAHKDKSGDIDLENIYWVKPNNYNSPSDSNAASKDVLNKIYKNGQDVLIIPISSKFRNTRDVAESFLESFRANLHKTKRNVGSRADEDKEPKSIENWNKGSKVTEAENANDKKNKKFKMTIRRV